MALFAGLGAGQGGCREAGRQGGAARAGAASGGRGLREKVNAWRGAQPPEIAEFGGFAHGDG